MRQMTEQNMINAFGGESMANMRYRHFATRADSRKGRLWRRGTESRFRQVALWRMSWRCQPQ